MASKKKRKSSIKKAFGGPITDLGQMGGMNQVLSLLSDFIDNKNVNDPTRDYLAKKQKLSSENPGRIPTPDEALVQNDINLVKAERKANNNPWVNGLAVAGNMAQQVGMQGMKSSDPTKTVKGEDVSTDGFSGFLNNLINSKSEVKAFGGSVNKNVEVEGGEVGQLPDGSILGFEGPDHEQGGVKTNLPNGTDIYSKRIKIKGETMAQRKLKREKRVAKAEKNSKVFPGDDLSRNTRDRVNEVANKEEMLDMQAQEAVNQMANAGVIPTPGQKKFKYGGKTRQKLTPIVGESEGIINTPINYGTPGEIINTKEYTEGIDDIPQNQNSLGEILKNTFGSPTGGDLMGMYGNLYGAWKNRDLTYQNRSGDLPNVNSFEDYGKDALESNNKAKSYIEQQKEQALNNLRLSQGSASRSNRNTARGVNTQRALDLSTDAATNLASNAAILQASGQMADLFKQEAMLNNDKDRMWAMGDQTRRDANTADRDAFFTNLASNEQGIGNAISLTGKALNDLKERDFKFKNLNDLSDHTSIDENGNVTQNKDTIFTSGGYSTNENLKRFEEDKTYRKLNISEDAWNKLPEFKKKKHVNEYEKRLKMSKRKQ